MIKKTVTKKFKKEDLDSILDQFTDGISGLKFIEASGWTSWGKGESNNFIFEFEGLFYEVQDSRTGSYFTEYYYESSDWPDEVECDQVVKVPVTTLKWESVVMVN